MRVIGPETDEDRDLRRWFSEQQWRDLDRLSDGAKTLIQLTSGLYGVLFAVLAFSNEPDYLQHLSVQIFGSASIGAFFLSLFAATLVVLPKRWSYQEDNLTEMHQVYRAMVKRKSVLLRRALWLFLVGTGCLVGVIIAVLWGF